MRAPLIFLCGPSGSGKDSLIAYARERLAGSKVLFAHRYITRPVSVGSENHIALDDAEFYCREDAGLFALSWRSHGNCYAIGTEIDIWMAAGCRVVVSGSRGHIAAAQARYPGLHVLWVEVAPAVLRARLEARGRETSVEIEQRLQQAGCYSLPAGGAVSVIDNNASLAVAGEAVCQLLRELL